MESIINTKKTNNVIYFNVNDFFKYKNDHYLIENIFL